MSTPVAPAEAALERGDYGLCLQLLEPLVADCPITDPAGAQIRMLMVTAWMGQGQEEKALSTCRLLTRCRDNEVRTRAKQLLEVLEAPSLQRPARWSMQLPTLDLAPQMGERPRPIRRRRNQGPPPPPPPPTGPTTAAAPGFAVVVLLVFIGLTVLLSGCGRLTADIGLPGPDRVQLGWTIDSGSSQPLPWQGRFARSLEALSPRWSASQPRGGSQHFQAPVLRSDEAQRLLQNTAAAAAAAAGLDLPAPQLELKERNWLIGVQQRLELSLDLQALKGLPLPELRVRLTPPAAGRHSQGSPQKPTIGDGALLWPLEAGQKNRLTLRIWRWSRLGLGALVVVVLLGVTLLLQRLRLKLGFGYPELPS